MEKIPTPTIFNLPPSEELAKLEQISKGSADKIVTAWLENQAIQSENSKAVIENNRQIGKRGVFAGSILAIAAILLGAYGIFNKTDLYAVAALVAPISGLAGIFIWGYRPK